MEIKNVPHQKLVGGEVEKTSGNDFQALQRAPERQKAGNSKFSTSKLLRHQKDCSNWPEILYGLLIHLSDVGNPVKKSIRSLLIFCLRPNTVRRPSMESSKQWRNPVSSISVWKPTRNSRSIFLILNFLYLEIFSLCITLHCTVCLDLE